AAPGALCALGAPSALRALRALRATSTLRAGGPSLASSCHKLLLLSVRARSGAARTCHLGSRPIGRRTPSRARGGPTEALRPGARTTGHQPRRAWPRWDQRASRITPPRCVLCCKATCHEPHRLSCLVRALRPRCCALSSG